MADAAVWGRCPSCDRWLYGLETTTAARCCLCTPTPPGRPHWSQPGPSITAAPETDIWALCTACNRWFYCTRWSNADAASPACPVCAAQPSAMVNRAVYSATSFAAVQRLLESHGGEA